MKAVKAVIDFVMDILETVVFIGSLFIVVYLFIMQPNQVNGASMQPSFYTGDYILVSKITYKFRKMKRGDVVVLKSPKNPDIEYIKRIIGLPGDKVVISEGNVYVNDRLLPEKFTSAKTNVWPSGYAREGIPMHVPEESVLVFGDNRPRSSDSREFGPIPVSSIIGQVFYRYFPSTKIGKIKNPFPKDLRSYIERSKSVAFNFSK